MTASTDASGDATQMAYYTRLPAEHHIRILTIEPAPYSDKSISCRIEAVDFRTFTYAALSYSWGMDGTGDASPNRTIQIMGQTVAVTQNLYEGLLRLRPVDKALQIWIDAVCINQNDLEERNSQVAQMANIYRNAETVLVWLGETKLDEKYSLPPKYLSDIAEHQSRDHGSHWKSCVASCLLEVPIDDCACQRGTNENDRQIWRNEAIHPIDDKSSIVQLIGPDGISKEFAITKLVAVVEFVSRRYWSRRWIVQELCLAKSQTWYWDSHQYQVRNDTGTGVSSLTVPARDLWSALSDSLVSECRDLLTNKTIRTAEDIQGGAASQLIAMGTTQQNDIVRLLVDLKNFQCGDPRDLIYAVAGLSKQVIVPDYNLSLLQVFMNFTRSLLEAGRFDIWLENLINDNDLADLAGPEEVPSWALDIRSLQYGLNADSHVPLSIAVESDDVLCCDVVCCGIIKEVEYNEDEEESDIVALTYDHQFENAAWEWRIDVPKTVDRLPAGWPIPLSDESEVEEALMRRFSPYINSTAGQEKILQEFVVYFPYNAQKDQLQPGDAVCLLSHIAPGGRWMPVILRAIPGRPGSYRLVDFMNGDMSSGDNFRLDHEKKAIESAVAERLACEADPDSDLDAEREDVWGWEEEAGDGMSWLNLLKLDDAYAHGLLPTISATIRLC